jgi:hypothetical protein
MPGPSSGVGTAAARNGKVAHLSRYLLGFKHALRSRDFALTVFLAPDQLRIGAANFENLPIEPIVAETEKLPIRRNSLLNSRSRNSDGSGGRF